MEEDKLKEPHFVKLYFNDLGRLYNLTNKAKNLFFEMCKRIDLDKTFPNVVTLSSKEKQKIAISAKIAKDKDDMKNIYNTNKYLSELVRKRVITKVDSNTFVVNPNLVGRVDFKSLNNLNKIGVEITYDMIGRNIITIIEEEKL